MDHATVDFAHARQWMVDGQVRPNKVQDPRVIEAMRVLPREAFVPPAQAALAYADCAVPLGHGRVLLEPMVIARLAQAAAVRAGERALVIGAGTGYSAALLAACGAHVTALEEDAALLDHARHALHGNAAVKLVQGKLAAGWAAAAPYDLVFVDGALDEVPAAIAQQVRSPRGRLVAIRTGAGRIGQAVLGEHSGSGLSFQPLFDCAAPLLPALRREPGFVF